MWIILNQILETKIAQYALLGFCALLLLGLCALGIKLKTLQVENKYLIGELVKTSAQLQTQNAAIKEAGEKADILLKRFNENSATASKIKLQSDKILLGISEYQFEGECANKVSQALKITKDGFKQYSGVIK